MSAAPLPADLEVFSRRRAFILAWGLVAVGFLLAFRHVLVKLVIDWGADPNYSHGFLVVPVAAWLTWDCRHRLAVLPDAPRPMLGLLLLVASLAMLAGGVLGAELLFSRLPIIGVLAATVLALHGPRHLRVLALPLAFLLLMIPIPAILFNQVAFPLQLFASRLGELALGVAGVPVLREGNLITLSNTTLEVAEACSGIRSLVSLLTLAIVYGYLVEPRRWARLVLALSAVPVAILANAARVAGTGIAAHRIGPEAALGFFHEFSGWLVFLVAFALLFVIQRLVARLPPAPRTPPSASEPPTRPTSRDARLAKADARRLLTRAAVVAGCLAIGALLVARASHGERVPPRLSLASFPDEIGKWRAESADTFDQRILGVLGVDEYVSRSYAASGLPPVGLYIGYYSSQRQGDTMHSPLNCLPGAGWEPIARGRLLVAVPSADGADAPARTIDVNRIVVQKGLDRQLVLYWYQSHGRVVASEYAGKAYLVLDAIRLNRTDAAMVRVITPLDGSDDRAAAAATEAASRFVSALFPRLDRYLPR